MGDEVATFRIEGVFFDELMARWTKGQVRVRAIL